MVVDWAILLNHQTMLQPSRRAQKATDYEVEQAAQGDCRKRLSVEAYGSQWAQTPDLERTRLE